MSDEQREPQAKGQKHLQRLRDLAQERKPWPDGRCAGTDAVYPVKGGGSVVSLALGTGRTPSGNAGRKIRVLLIEPDKTLRNYLKDTLNHHGFEVTVSDHPDGRAMYQSGVQSDLGGEYQIFRLIIWDHPAQALDNGTNSQTAQDLVNAIQCDNRQRIPIVMITDVAEVKQGMEELKRKKEIAFPVIVLDRENMNLASDNGLHAAATAIDSAARAAIARAAAPMKGKSR